MRARNLRIVTLLATLVATACASDDSSQAPTFTAPEGIVIPHDRGASAMARGLWISTTPNDPSCCWISADATVTANKTAAANTIAVTIGIPGFRFFAVHGQTVTVSVDGKSTTFRNLKQGNHVLSAKLDEKLQPLIGHVDVIIRSANPFVPVREGVNGDARHLGVVLKGIAFS